MGIPDEEVRKQLERKGYVPVDLRLMKPSEELVELLSRGAFLGLFELTQNQVSLLRAEGARLGIYDKNRKRNDESRTYSDTATMLGDLRKALPSTPPTYASTKSNRSNSLGRDAEDPRVASSADAKIARVVAETDLDAWLGSPEEED